MPRRRNKQTDPKAALVLALLMLAVLSVLGGHAWVLIVLFLAGGVYVAYLRIQAKARRAHALALSDLRSLSHRDLELHVAAVLGALPGWKAQATQGRRDQGADVIATGPSALVVAIQVKHYPTNNVGNKAVQEIVASKAIYRATQAVVFTSGPGYTVSAHELARANGVRLWTASDLFALQAAAQTGGSVQAGGHLAVLSRGAPC